MREALPNRRSHEVFNLEFRGLNYVVGVGHYHDGRLAELFVDCTKASSQAAMDARDIAILISIGLQFGVAPDALRSALGRETDGSPTGLAAALLDLLFPAEEKLQRTAELIDLLKNNGNS